MSGDNIEVLHASLEHFFDTGGSNGQLKTNIYALINEMSADELIEYMTKYSSNNFMDRWGKIVQTDDKIKQRFKLNKNNMNGLNQGGRRSHRRRKCKSRCHRRKRGTRRR